MSEVPRRATRHPRSLTQEQLTHSSVSAAGEPVRVSAWVVWEDGVEELVHAYAVAWTPRAVQIRFGVPPHQHHTWVWAGAVSRATTDPGGTGPR
ncbi:MAG: hypothetical protein ABIW80_00455 [Lapillicoccus sp.]